MMYFVFEGEYGDLVLETTSQVEAVEYCESHADAWYCSDEC